jgi:hypothetical protein
VAVIRALLASGASINKANNCRQTPFHYPQYSCNILEVTKEFLDSLISQRLLEDGKNFVRFCPDEKDRLHISAFLVQLVALYFVDIERCKY